jgi:hypothetical protein
LKGGRDYVDEEGPRRGLSLRVWKENLPKNLATQEVEFLGQLLTYMVTTKSAMFATTKLGTSHGTHRLNALNSSPPPPPTASGADDVVAEAGLTGWTLTTIWAAEDDEPLRITAVYGL